MWDNEFRLIYLEIGGYSLDVERAERFAARIKGNRDPFANVRRIREDYHPIRSLRERSCHARRSSDAY